MQIDSNLQKGYQKALELAIENLKSVDPQEIAQSCGAEYDSQSRIFKLEYLKDVYAISPITGQTTKESSSEEVPLTTKVLLLNYLISARAQTPTGNLIAFRDIPGAATYEPSFQKRAVLPLIKAFDGKPEMLYMVGQMLGGSKADVADASVKIRVLPLFEITYAIWHSDDEFPAHGTILFDSSVRRLMTAECIVVAASNGVYKMMGLARSLSSS